MENNKKTPGNLERAVLMLCYHFPPVSSAGTQRSVGFARWLPQFGWQPLVLAVRKSRNRFEYGGESIPEDVEVVRSFEWDLYGVLTFATGVFNRTCDFLRVPRRPSPFYRWCLPDPQIAWFTTVRGALLARRCACIYASCSPFSSAVSACLIKVITRKPVVLDFRDAWTINPHATHRGFHRRIVAWLEHWVVRNCDFLVLNTPGAETAYRRRYPIHAEKMMCIPNGFDRLNVPDRQNATDRFTIMHLGDFYRSRTPERLLQALANLGNRDIEFVQVGPKFDAYARFKDRVSIRVVEHVPHAEALALMQTASVLYVSQGWEEGVTDYIAVASKTYEYLATGLPIIAECPPGDNADVVRQYAARAWVVTSPSVEEIQAAVQEAYQSRHAHRPEVTRAFVDTFSRARLSERLSQVFDRVVSRYTVAA